MPLYQAEPGMFATCLMKCTWSATGQTSALTWSVQVPFSQSPARSGLVVGSGLVLDYLRWTVEQIHLALLNQ